MATKKDTATKTVKIKALRNNRQIKVRKEGQPVANANFKTAGDIQEFDPKDIPTYLVFDVNGNFIIKPALAQSFQVV